MFTVYDELGAADRAYVESVLRTLEDAVDFGDIRPLYSVHFITDSQIRDLNREYRGIDEPTDILTFCTDRDDFIPDDEEGDDLGDIFISLESMQRNAAAFSVPEEEELKRLLLHGLLHLRGDDHESNDFSSEPMLIEQERILGSLGWKA